LLKRLAFCFRQQQYCEKNTNNAESTEHPENRVLAIERFFDIAGNLGDNERKEKADKYRYTGTLSFNVRTKYLAHQYPRNRTPAYTECGKINNKRNRRQPGYLFYHFVCMLYILQIKI